MTGQPRPRTALRGAGHSSPSNRGYVSWEDVNYPRGELPIKQVRGAALSSVTVKVSGDYVERLRGELIYDEPGLGDYTQESRLDLGSMSAGADSLIYVDLEHRHVTPIRVELELECVAREGGYTRKEHYVSRLDPRPEPPPGPSGRRRFRGDSEVSVFDPELMVGQASTGTCRRSAASRGAVQP